MRDGNDQSEEEYQDRGCDETDDQDDWDRDGVLFVEIGDAWIGEGECALVGSHFGETSAAGHDAAGETQTTLCEEHVD